MTDDRQDREPAPHAGAEVDASSDEDGSGEAPDAKTRWAKDRTDWAEDRTLLANERTYAGWLRTGAACVALSLGLHAVFEETRPEWVAKATATVFLLAGAGVFAAAAQRSREAQMRIEEHATRAQPAWRMVVLAAVLVLGTIATGVILWTL